MTHECQARGLKSLMEKVRAINDMDTGVTGAIRRAESMANAARWQEVAEEVSRITEFSRAAQIIATTHSIAQSMQIFAPTPIAESQKPSAYESLLEEIRSFSPAQEMIDAFAARIRSLHDSLGDGQILAPYLESRSGDRILLSNLTASGARFLWCTGRNPDGQQVEVLVSIEQAILTLEVVPASEGCARQERIGFRATPSRG